MQILGPVRAAGIAGTPMKYKWNLEVSRAIRHPLDGEHPRLAKALGMVNLPAAFALVLANAEWVAWRFEGIIDIGDALARIEAGYAALADPRYADIPQPDEPFPAQLQDAYGPLKLARMLIPTACEYYRRRDPIVSAVALSMALLARHVCSNRVAFDKWLSAVLRNCHAHYPPSKPPSDEQGPLPRAFFEAPGHWDVAAGRALLAQFLAELDPAANPYLLSAQDLHGLGFQGTPYRLD